MEKEYKNLSSWILCLSNRYNTIILMDPTYSQATALHQWGKTIQPLLIEYTTKSTSTTGSLLFVPFEEESTSISDIQMQPPGQIFYIDGQLTLTNENQHFCTMACSNCNIPFTRKYNLASQSLITLVPLQLLSLTK